MRRSLLQGMALCCAVLVTPSLLQAAEHPDGFAKDVTGGGSAAAVHPATLDELKQALCSTYDHRGNCTDATPRVVVLDHTFDFRGSVVANGSATTTETGCMVKACPKGGSQLALNGANNFC